jgi:hypothetical protein
MKKYIAAISLLATAFVISAQISTTKEKIGSSPDPADRFSADRFEVIEYPMNDGKVVFRKADQR